MKHLILTALFLAVGCQLSASDKKADKWYRGNTHTHTTLSDGDTEITKVVDWYHNAGYDFLLITDHNLSVNPEQYGIPMRNGNFILIPGNEITQNVHATAVNLSAPLAAKTIKEAYKQSGSYAEGVSGDIESQANTATVFANAITANNGVTILNHPNFSKGLQGEEMIAANAHIFELFNGNWDCYNWGSERHKPTEEKWDEVLSAGKKMYAVAADDAHNFGTFDRKSHSPGRGWIMVNAPSLNPAAITEAISQGKMYASSGVLLKDCRLTDNSIKVTIDKKATEAEHAKGKLFANQTATGQEGFLIEVIGYNGKVLKTSKSTSLSYTLSPEDKYARIRVSYCVKTPEGYDHFYAWTQPVMK